MTPKSDNMRLASLSDRGASLYNAYHLLSQIVGLYVQASALEQEALRPAWSEISDEILLDVGTLYGIWDKVQRDPKETPAVGAGLSTGHAVIRMCRRTGRLLTLMTMWTPTRRWARVIQLCEKRWQALAAQMAEQRPALKAELSELIGRCGERVSRLEAILETYRKEDARLRAASAASDERLPPLKLTGS